MTEEQKLGPGIEEDPEIKEALNELVSISHMYANETPKADIRAAEHAWAMKALQLLLEKHPKRYRTKVQVPEYEEVKGAEAS